MDFFGEQTARVLSHRYLHVPLDWSMFHCVRM